MSPVPGLVIAERFRLNRQIGRGGMGSVWHATHLGLDVACAVKFIEGEFAEMPEAQARFQREAKAAAHLRSPHVVQILDHGVWQGTPYLAMELLEGEDLGKRLARVKRLPPRDVCLIVAQVCRALTKAHAAGIVHRDLKPDNVFLVRDDEREIAKVLDFGIAKAAPGALDFANTKTGAMLGTPYYMSPEQAQGNRALDARSDLWSLGVIVYQTLTGHLPFESEALGDLLMKIMVAPLPVPTVVAPDLAAGFDAWWAKAASRDANGRFQSAKELSDELSRVFGQAPAVELSARTPSPSSTTGPQSPATPEPSGTMRMTPAAPERGPHPATPQAVTGGPMARSYGSSAPVVRSRGGLVAGIAIGGVALALVALVTVVAVYSRSKAAAVSAPTAPPSAVAATPTAPVQSASPAAPEAPTAPVPTALAAPAPSETSLGADAGAPAGGRPRSRGASGAGAPPANQPPAKPPDTKKPKDVDFGI
jgi:serine/threonine-protein kinase